MSSSPNVDVIDLWPTVKGIQNEMKDYLNAINAMLNGLIWMNSNLGEFLKYPNIQTKFIDSAFLIDQHAAILADTTYDMVTLFSNYGNLIMGNVNSGLENTGVFTKFLNLHEKITITEVVLAINDILSVYINAGVDFKYYCDRHLNQMRELLYMFMINVDNTIDRNNPDQVNLYNIILDNNARYSKIPYVMNNIGFLLLSFLNYIKSL